MENFRNQSGAHLRMVSAVSVASQLDGCNSGQELSGLTPAFDRDPRHAAFEFTRGPGRIKSVLTDSG